MKQFQVPQFIEVEDRILGPVTMRQFFIMLIPITLTIIMYFILDLWLAIVLAIPSFIITAIFAFVRPNGMTFMKFVSSFLSYTFKPRLYIWKREEAQTSFEEIKESAEEKRKSESLKTKKGHLETGSRVDENELKNQKDTSDYIDELLHQ